ncbi:unnamed protein product [Protopolystoma xenopodis]|uniref:Uncharacterized protein n=1 Tax=Protopolystoma xenopodis TaxID=117903 RepID=A0A3S5B2Y5_9PLAT|nr:unnamed protein product [Protopolystoma xenopodis]
MHLVPTAPGHVSRPTYRPQYSTTMRICEPGSAYSSVTRVQPVKRYSSSTGPTIYGTGESVQDMGWANLDTGSRQGSNVYTSSRTVQPLRINVYNSYPIYGPPHLTSTLFCIIRPINSTGITSLRFSFIKEPRLIVYTSLRQLTVRSCTHKYSIRQFSGYT